MLGIILAGGNGTRLYPTSVSISKHLVPIAGKPMLYYALSTLIYLGCNRIAVIHKPEDLEAYNRVLEPMRKLNLEIETIEQRQPEGIPQGISLSNKFRSNRPAYMLLGDNIFVGGGLKKIVNNLKQESFGTLTKSVGNPHDYGVLIRNSENYEFVEKPSSFVSNEAISGLYKLPEDVDESLEFLKKSDRGEYEIIDVMKYFASKSRFEAENVGRGIFWCDAGQFSRIRETDQLVSLLEDNSRFLIGSPEEAALNAGLISDTEFANITDQMPECPYKKKLVLTIE